MRWRMADDTIDPAGDQSVSRLDCHQPAESPAKHEDWPNPLSPRISTEWLLCAALLIMR